MPGELEGNSSLSFPSFPLCKGSRGCLHRVPAAELQNLRRSGLRGARPPPQGQVAVPWGWWHRAATAGHRSCPGKRLSAPKAPCCCQTGLSLHHLPKSSSLQTPQCSQFKWWAQTESLGPLFSHIGQCPSTAELSQPSLPVSVTPSLGAPLGCSPLPESWM